MTFAANYSIENHFQIDNHDRQRISKLTHFQIKGLIDKEFSNFQINSFSN